MEPVDFHAAGHPGWFRNVFGPRNAVPSISPADPGPIGFGAADEMVESGRDRDGRSGADPVSLRQRQILLAVRAPISNDRGCGQGYVSEPEPLCPFPGTGHRTAYLVAPASLVDGQSEYG